MGNLSDFPLDPQLNIESLVPQTPIMIYLDALRATYLQSILTSRYGSIIASDIVTRIEREQARNLRALRLH